MIDQSPVATAGAALDAAGLRWCLLRAPSSGGSEYDLLVEPGHGPRLTSALAAAGLAPLRSLGRGTHRFYVGYDPATGRWLELDLVTELGYGPGYCLRLGSADQCLDRRSRTDGLWRLAAGDEFWTLLLHRLLDKRTIDAWSAARLGGAAQSSAATSPLATPVADLLPPPWTVQAIIAACRAGDRERLQGLRADLLRGALRAAPVRAPARVARSMLGRMLERPVQLRSRRGMRVALLGPDGSGKSSAARAIAAGSHLPARIVYFGLWADESGGRLRWAARVASRPLRARWRYLVGCGHAWRGRLVVFDRYPYDALVPAGTEPGRWKRRYLELVGRCCPRPDRVFVLDVPGELAFRRKRESEPAKLEAEGAGYRALAERVGAELVDAERPAAEVAADLTARIWSGYLNRLAGSHG
jgi:thymidylate kinase